ncbi:DUF6252 family protein [Flavobacterium pallidum]|uniref:Fibronectin type-III domain-containing protein n=1 Tax=Flavobacterium pallidum TaxID=2172098 RepID=A0A2S1SJT5_9FLAO|nr:DUF6252 family protein [Flavobacterium pallidum]AWI26683.1 hypothetical protein HYN49_12675 [Flavobacterium pallidum]
MKNFKIIFRVFALLTLLSLSSCSEDVEPIDPYVLNPNITECPEPTSFSSSDFVETKVTLTWVSEGDLWEVEYGPAGFVHGQGTSVTTAEHSFSVDGLDTTLEYDFYVRTNCGELKSDWAGPISVDDEIIIDPNPNPNPQTGVFKADFDGTTFVATSTSAFISGDGITITGLKANGQGFAILLDGQTTGTYTDNAGIFYNLNANSEFGYSNANENFETNGEVVITEINTTAHTISGTFHFTGIWSEFDANPAVPNKEFTNGTFTVSYTSTNPNPSTDTFFAKIDGTEFAETQIDVAAVSGTGVPDYISIVGTKPNDDNLGLRVNEGLSPGTYNITGPLTDDVVGAHLLKDDVLYQATAGTVTITQMTATHVTGTFSVTMKNFEGTVTLQVTEGAFSVDY